MEDLRCTSCNTLLGKKMDIRYGEIKCYRCGAYNIIDRLPRQGLTASRRMATMDTSSKGR